MRVEAIRRPIEVVPATLRPNLLEAIPRPQSSEAAPEREVEATLPECRRPFLKAREAALEPQSSLVEAIQGRQA